MNLELLDKALECFEPPVPEGDLPEVRETLCLIAEDYKHNASQKNLIPQPFRMVGEPDEAYLARTLALAQAPRTRGRPMNLAQEMLVLNLRNLLMAKGCHYGAPKASDRRSRLVELSKVIDQMAGGLGSHVNWANIAADMSDPLHQLELVVGKKFELNGEDRTDMKRMLGENLVRPPKRKS